MRLSHKGAKRGKKAYKKDGKNGIYTGYAEVHMESGEVAYFWTDIVFNR